MVSVSLTIDLDHPIFLEKIGNVKVRQCVEYGKSRSRGNEAVVEKHAKKHCQTHKQTDKHTNKMSFIERLNGESDLLTTYCSSLDNFCNYHRIIKLIIK